MHEEPVGEARPLGIAQYRTTTESEVEGSSGEACVSSWPREDDTTGADDRTVANAFGDAQPPGIAKRPRRNLNSQRLLVKLGQSKWHEQRRHCSSRNACW